MMPGLGGCSKSHSSPTPHFPQAELTCLPRWASAHHQLSAISWIGEGGQEGDPTPFLAPGWVAQCLPWPWRPNSAFYRCRAEPLTQAYGGTLVGENLLKAGSVGFICCDLQH